MTIGTRMRLIRERLEVMLRYCPGGILKCSRCPENRYVVLDFHHIGGNGNAHRKELGRGSLHRWLRENGYPEGYEILCANCHRVEHGTEITKAYAQVAFLKEIERLCQMHDQLLQKSEKKTSGGASESSDGAEAQD